MGGLKRKGERDLDEVLGTIRFLGVNVNRALDGVKAEVKKLNRRSKKIIKHIKSLEEHVADLEKRVKTIENYDWDDLCDGHY